jgi:hypothetical protein
MTASTERLILKALLFAALVLWAFAGCASAPPGSYGVNAFGFGVTYSTPGWSAVPPVVQSSIVTQPTLMVPANSPAASALVATSDSGPAVPITIAPVAKPVLAVPVKQ